MVKMVIFDFDGTLTNTMDISALIYGRMSEKYGLRKLSAEELHNIKSLTSLQRIIKLGVPFYKIPKLYKESREISSEYIKLAQPYPGMEQLLTQLKDEGIILAIVSSGNEENIKGFLSIHNLDQFSFVEGKASLNGKKRIIKKLLKKTTFEIKDTVYIADEIRDIKSCKDLSMKIIAVSWGFDDITLIEKANPDFIAHSITDISLYLSHL